jgi:hypothetical protein
MAASEQGRTGPGLVALRLVASAGALVMAVTIVWALASGVPLGQDGTVLVGLVWGRVSLIDLLLMLGLGGGWIAWREGTPLRAVVTLALVTVTGSLAVLAYLAGAAWRARTAADVLLGPRRAAASRD